MIRNLACLTVRTVRIMSKKFKSDSMPNKPIINANESPSQTSVLTGSILSKSQISIEHINEEVEQLRSPNKSPSDTKSYSVIRLSNGLTATIASDIKNLINVDETSDSEEFDDLGTDYNSDTISIASNQSLESDVRPNIVPPNSEKLAACSLSIMAGSFGDPEDIQGLSHFLEHMVFMGSQKYPKENEFDSFITKNGGSDNAATECEYTTFYFECQEKHLEKALDIFSQFFISPLMKKEAMTRERKAIESEFQISLPSDIYRKQQIICSTASKDNPARKFTWGNQKTLMDNVTDDYLYKSVHEFRKKHYSAHRMKLAIQARLPEQTLKEWVIKYFSPIKSNDKPPDKFLVKTPFTRDFNKLFYIESIDDICRLDINWVLPPVWEHYKSKPLNYLSFLIGHEGKGSLLSYLRKKFWALSLSAGVSDDGLACNSIYTVFTISVFLTDLGRAFIDEVLESIFSYVKMIGKEEPSAVLFEEMQLIAEIEFKYAEENRAVDNVESLSENMLFYPPEDYLTATELYFEFQPKLITEFLQMLTPASANVLVSAKGTENTMKLDKVEPWFETKYSCIDLPPEWVNRWNNVAPYTAFYPPAPNDFITTDFTLQEVSQIPKYPVKCKSSDLMNIWYKADDKFHLPVAFIGIQILTPRCKSSAFNSVLTAFYVRALRELLSEELYPANAALLEYCLEINAFGIGFSVYGFNEKLSLILDKIGDTVSKFNFKITEGLFLAIKELLVRLYYNDNLKPAAVARDLRMTATVEEFYTSVEKFKASKIVTYELLREFAYELYQGIQIQCLIQGNISKEQGIETCEHFAQKLESSILPEDDLPKFTVLKLPYGEKCIRVNAFNISDTNCVTTNYYQFTTGTIKDYVTLELLLLMMEEPLFDKLRTQEQLGYDVSSSVRETYGIIGFTMTVHSQIDKFTPDHVQFRMADFLQNFYDYVKKMPNDEFKDAVSTLIKIKNRVDLHLKEEVTRNWSEIKNMEFLFDRLEKEVKFISSLKKKHLHSILEKYFWQKRNLKKLTVQVIGQKGKKECREPPTTLPSQMPNELSYHFDHALDHPIGYFIYDIPEFKKKLQAFPHWKLVR